ncbi:2Fe-2S iron-sulfur cluster-binding protein [Halobaculum sp. MBLA0147]|uniref:2Fe-2S iron-sulfur cluster-binding protein n=1 Tax=Halobaculum sp. MBLA0147 TaxID=3079934 RepID=UPI0035249F38
MPETDEAADEESSVVSPDPDGAEPVTVTVHHDEQTTTVTARRGEPLRDALRRANLSPYTRLTERLNCGGRGLCATCGVRVLDDVAPDHWHDRLAERFGYPRLSCQLPAEDGLEVALVSDKLVWGGRE